MGVPGESRRSRSSGRREEKRNGEMITIDRFVCVVVFEEGERISPVDFSLAAAPVSTHLAAGRTGWTQCEQTGTSS